MRFVGIFSEISISLFQINVLTLYNLYRPKYKINTLFTEMKQFIQILINYTYKIYKNKYRVPKTGY